MSVLITAITGVLVVATLIPLSRRSHWLVRGLDFPRLQLAVTAVAVSLCQAVLLNLSDARTWAMLTVTAACAAWQLWWILPYARFWRTEVNAPAEAVSNRTVSILTSNVLTPNRGADKLLRLVEEYQPDVLVTLESDSWWESQLASLEAEMPETIKCPLDNLYGMHVYSRLPLREPQIEYLVEDDVPSMHALLELRTGDRVRLHILHPAPPSPTENTHSAERDAELVIVARNVADSDLPVIVTGDLNDVAWSRTTRLFRKLSGLLDPRIGRGMFNTFHADYPFLRWPLDHLFHSNHFTVDEIRRLSSIGSDHFPLFTRLVFTPAAGADQTGLDADAADRDFAESITEAKGVGKGDVPEPGE